MNAQYPPLRLMAACSLRWAWRTLLEGAALYGASYYPMKELLDQQLNASAEQEERE